MLLIRRRPLDPVDHQKLHRPLGRLQLEPQLFLQRHHEARTSRLAAGLPRPVLRARAFGRKLHVQVVIAGQAGPVQPLHHLLIPGSRKRRPRRTGSGVDFEARAEAITARRQNYMVYIGLPGESYQALAFNPAPAGDLRFPKAPLALRAEMDKA